ncbi:MAG: tatB, partial [Ilumatobacteraceae bacterium]|nr:tatB [Ilumatobacteraceae bacterium]
MFNLSGSETIFLLLIALVVLGPEKLPEAVRRFGKAYGEFKKMTTGFQSELRSALDEPMKEMRETAEQLRKSANLDFNFEPDRVDGGETAEPVVERPYVYPPRVVAPIDAVATDGVAADAVDLGVDASVYEQPYLYPRATPDDAAAAAATAGSTAAEAVEIDTSPGVYEQPYLSPRTAPADAAVTEAVIGQVCEPDEPEQAAAPNGWTPVAGKRAAAAAAPPGWSPVASTGPVASGAPADTRDDEVAPG